MAGGASPSPTVFKKLFRDWVGEALGSPVVNGPSTVGSAEPGADAEPQQRQFLQPQPPVGRQEFRPATQFLRAGNDATTNRSASLVMGVRGKATMSTECSSGAVPGGVLVTLPPRAKSLAARRRRNSPVHEEFNPNFVPPSVTAAPCHLPPRGKAERGEAKRSFAQNSFAYFSFQEK